MTSESESALPKGETWHGSCHCGAQAFTVNLQQPLYEQNVNSCNCSICALNGYLFVYPENVHITWTSGGPRNDDSDKTSTSTSTPALTPYTFAQGRIAHSFCSRCGTSMCGKSTTPDFFPDHTALNVRTFKDVELEKLAVKKVDGKSV